MVAAVVSNGKQPAALDYNHGTIRDFAFRLKVTVNNTWLGIYMLKRKGWAFWFVFCFKLHEIWNNIMNSNIKSDNNTCV
jgi:hypothetical protein